MESAPSHNDVRDWVVNHHGMVWAVCFAVLRDAALADEAVQDTFLLAYQQRDRDLARPGAWLRTLARNLAIDRLRRRRKEAEVRIRQPESSPSNVPTSSPEAAIAEALETLDEDSQALLLQFHLEGRTTQELAADWGLTDAAVRKRLSRARSVLRDEYQAQLMRWSTPPRSAVVVAAAVLAALPRDGRATVRTSVIGMAAVAGLGLVVARPGGCSGGTTLRQCRRRSAARGW